MSSIEWQTVLGYAEDSAISSRRPILFYYFNPECISCQQMDTLTYSSKDVIIFVKESLIPLRIDINDKGLYDKYNAIWTPTLLVLDYQGNEVHRTIGFLEPDKFIAHMHLGIAKVHFSTGEFDAANVHLKRLMDRFPESDVVPEAIYFSGVNFYKQKNDPTQLKRAYEKLLSRYPDDKWTKRATPFSLV